MRCDHRDPVAALKRVFGTEPMAQILVFVSPACDFPRVVADLHAAFPDCLTLACTTAGEIGARGYAEDTIQALAFPRAHFAASAVAIPSLDSFDAVETADRLVQSRIALRDRNPERRGGFAFLLVDGLSMKEDALLTTIAPAMGPFQLFGGSAGDGRNFQQTLLGLDGAVLRGAAVLNFVVTDCDTRVFSLNHLTPAETRMVVTGADPERRVVKEINAEPAAREYARIIGKDPFQLDEFTFAAHPVVVRFGDTHHVRAIQRVNGDGELVFFSAIDEGMVLSVAEPESLHAHLDRELAGLAADDGPPAHILACDCILRRIEAEQNQTVRDVSTVLSRHRILGFSTYGEQIGSMHVNHTMTGVALYPPRGSR